jgi:hypothetical protein
MNGNKRPISITILAALYVTVGVLGSVAHFHGLVSHQPDAIGAELTELVAIVCGVFLFRGDNWARWLALAWIVFHVVLSAFHNLREFAIHAVLCAVIAGLLFRPAAARYFRGNRIVSS